MANGEYDPLAALSYAWVHEKASAAGLKLLVPAPVADAYQTAPRDAYQEFMRGLYRRYKSLTGPGDGRHYRHYDCNPSGNAAVGISVDPSVWQRWQAFDDYRLETLTAAGCRPPDQGAPPSG